MTRFLFQDEASSFEALRAAGFASDGGAALGEVLAIASAIVLSACASAWQREWARAGAKALIKRTNPRVGSRKKQL